MGVINSQKKIENFFRPGKGGTCHAYFLAHLNKGKSLKSLFSPLSFVPMLLEPYSFNINGRKAFRLFLVSSRSDHAFTLNHAPTTPNLYTFKYYNPIIICSKSSLLSNFVSEVLCPRSNGDLIPWSNQ